jgi:siroheme synthase-like protein
VPSSDEASLHPLFLKLEGRAVLVVGAGEVAERKIRTLLDANARVRVVAPEATEGVRQLAASGAIEWQARAFEETDVDGVWLVFAATDDGRAQRRVAAASEARTTFCVAIDDPANASAYSGAIVRRPPFLVAVSSSGQTPALTRLVRELIEELLPGQDVVETAAALRARWQAEKKPMGERFEELLEELRRRRG